MLKTLPLALRRHTNRSEIQMTTVAVIGLGEIGAGVARTMARTGLYTLTGFDVRAATLDGLRDVLRPTTSPRVASENAEVVFVAVMNDEQVRSVLTGQDSVLAAANLPRCIVILSTTTLETLLWAAEQAATRGVRLVDCAVSGPQGLAEFALTTMIGGDDEAYALVRPVIESFSNPAVHCGKLGNGMRAKLARNLVIYTDWMVAWEGARLAVAAGVPLEKFVEVVVASDRWVKPHMHFVTKGVGVVTPERPMATDTRTAAYADKDLKAALALGAELGLDLPAAHLALSRFRNVAGLEESS